MKRLRPLGIAAAIFLTALLGIVGPMDYADALSAEAEEKLARPLRARLIDTSTQCRLRECGPNAVMIHCSTRDGVQWYRRTCMVPR